MSAEESMFQEALAAIDHNERARARDLLTRLLKTNPQNPKYWLWMSAVVDSVKERTYCLKEAQKLDPSDPAVARGLALLGIQPAQPAPSIPLASQQRNWQGSSAAQFNAGKPKPAKTSLYIGGALVFFVLLVVAGIGLANAARRPKAAISYQPVAAITATATSTATVTPPPAGESGSPWLLTAQAYTPTPFYANTPHPLTEAFGLAIRAVDTRQWEKALTYLTQAAAGNPDSPDLPFRIGEVHRQLGDMEAALTAYNQALAIEPNFAPAYLGRARALLAFDPADGDAKADLDRAIELDPNMGESYFTLASYYIGQNELEKAEEAIDLGNEILPGTALAPYYTAQAKLQAGDFDAALEAIDQALAVDVALMPAYRLKAEILVFSGDAAAAREPLEIYAYDNDDLTAAELALLGSARAANGEIEEALQAFEQALALEPRQIEVLIERGHLYLEQQNGEAALADFTQALTIDKRDFSANLGKGRAYLLLQQYNDAYQQLMRAGEYAENDSQRAFALYWRALSLEPGNPKAALDDWRRLLDLPNAAVSAEMLAEAEEHMAALVTATPSPTAKPTVTPRPTQR